MSNSSWVRSIKRIFIGKSRDLTERGLFHQLSLVTLLAWVGLGADGLSSSCYGPEEAYKVLLHYPHMALFVAGAAAVTVFIICASYSQIIGAFPSGGGGYVVASRLLSPTVGVISGSALLIDYVLTITTSVASGMDALYSLKPEWVAWRFKTEIVGVLFLVILNLRGVRESVMVLLPVFFIFLLTHTFAILYAVGTHTAEFGALGHDTVASVHSAASGLGWFGMLAILFRSYSMGASSYTGIEAVSNGLSILREPRVRTGRRTMVLMAISLAAMISGLMVAYLLVQAEPDPSKTLNAVLMEKLTAHWSPTLGKTFVTVSMCSAAALLFIAAQAGFLGGPPVLASMALDRWMPSRFAALSDRFVTLNGVLIMGISALIMLVATHGSIDLLVVLYSINVFITFSLSQLGMVVHWWKQRTHEPKWRPRLAINAIGLGLTSVILVAMIVQKFGQGGWITVVMTMVLVAAAFGIRRHYDYVRQQLSRLDLIVEAAKTPPPAGAKEFAPGVGSKRTAVMLVNGFNGLGLHTLMAAARFFGGGFRDYVFVQIGVVDAGNFKGVAEIERLRHHVAEEAHRYVEFVRSHGGESESYTAIGHDIVNELEKLLPDLVAKHPRAVFFGGQLVFEKETVVTRWLHNYTAFALQRRLFLRGLPFAILPVRVQGEAG